MVQPSHPYITTGKTTALTIRTLIDKVMSMFFNTLSKFVIVFLPRNKYLLISWLHEKDAWERCKHQQERCHQVTNIMWRRARKKREAQGPQYFASKLKYLFLFHWKKIWNFGHWNFFFAERCFIIKKYSWDLLTSEDSEQLPFFSFLMTGNRRFDGVFNQTCKPSLHLERGNDQRWS